MSNTTAQATVDTLHSLFAIHGLPEENVQIMALKSQELPKIQPRETDPQHTIPSSI